jgi:hypothetical protein
MSEPTTLAEALAENVMLRRLNESLAARLAAASEVLGLAAERRGFTPEAVAKVLERISG